jgi:hypothetical protein
MNIPCQKTTCPKFNSKTTQIFGIPTTQKAFEWRPKAKST